MLSSAEAEEHEDIQRVHRYFQGLASEDADAPDISMAEYLRRRGANDTVMQLAECKCFTLSLLEISVRTQLILYSPLVDVKCLMGATGLCICILSLNFFICSGKVAGRLVLLIHCVTSLGWALSMCSDLCE